MKLWNPCRERLKTAQICADFSTGEKRVSAATGAGETRLQKK
jgi:hypothetical protein